MNTYLTTLITGAGAVIASVKGARTDNPELNEKRKRSYIGTSVATAATIAVGSSLNCSAYSNYYKEKLEAEYYRQAYVDSMTDEQLAAASEQLEGKLANSTTENQQTNNNFSK